MISPSDYVSRFRTMYDSVIYGTQIKDIPVDFVQEALPGKKPAILFDEKGQIKELHINQSLIKRILFKGEEIPNCPWQTLNIELLHKYKRPTTIKMLRGLYFEYKCLGGNAGMKVTDLPRKQRSKEKKKTIFQDRIDDAVIRFNRFKEDFGLIVTDSNVQVKGQKLWIPPKDNLFNWMQIYLDGTADLLSPINYPKIKYDAACIDLKLPEDRDICYQDKYYPWKSFHWGCPAEMDMIQPKVYDVLFELPFIFLVFDYRNNNPGYKVIPVVTHHGWPENKIGRDRLKELHRDVQWLVEKVVMWNEDGWPKDADPFNCKDCPILNCENRKTNYPI